MFPGQPLKKKREKRRARKIKRKVVSEHIHFIVSTEAVDTMDYT